MYYNFDDEPVEKFCYERYNKTIEVYFAGYFNIIEKCFIEKPCVLTIKNWTRTTKCKTYNDPKFYNLNEQIGIFNMVLALEEKDNNLELTVETLGGKYLEIYFSQPQIEFRVLD